MKFDNAICQKGGDQFPDYLFGFFMVFPYFLNKYSAPYPC